MTSRHTVRTHVVLPEALVQEVDARVGSRKRSAFIAEAIEEKLSRARLLEAAQEVAGSLADGYIPEWETPQSVTAWIDDLRRIEHRVVE